MAADIAIGAKNSVFRNCSVSGNKNLNNLNDCLSAMVCFADNCKLQIMCVLFTEEVGGILILQYVVDGTLQIVTEADEGDLLYDDIGCGLKVKQMQLDKRELLESLEMYYKVFVLGEE